MLFLLCLVSEGKMRFAMMIPAFLAYVSFISRFFFTKEERRRTANAFILLGLIGAFCYLIFRVYQKVDDRGFHQVSRDRTAWRLFLAEVEQMFTRIAHFFDVTLGPQGMFLGVIFATVLLLVGGVLYLLHRNAADPN